MDDQVQIIVNQMEIGKEKNIMDDEVMAIVDQLPIPTKEEFLESLEKKLEDQNRRIEALKAKIKILTTAGGSQKNLRLLQKKLNEEFVKLDKMLKTKLEMHSQTLHPTNIIHLATTEQEDNLPPIILYGQHEDNPNRLVIRQPSHQRTSSLQRAPSLQEAVPLHDHPVPSQQRKTEEKFQKIQKKLLDLCCNDIRSRSTKQNSNKDAQGNLNDDIKKQFDILYSELRVLEKELFHDDNFGDQTDFESFENSEKQTAFETLKRQNAMLIEQGQQFEVLFKEQQLEIENYRKKYMHTLQNVMEQHMRIASMENLRNCSEKKTHEEIVRMKNNLKKKLDHFAPMSNMLETCNNKLIHSVKRKTELERNYQEISDELRQLRKELANSTSGTYKLKCESLIAELKKTKELNEFNNKRVNQLNQQLQQAKSELERVKLKSNQTIKSTKKKCDFLRTELNSRINELEVELAESRAKTVANSK